jgi:hypothetical protein
MGGIVRRKGEQKRDSMDQDKEDIRFEVDEETEDREEEFSDELANEMLGTATGRTTERDVEFNPDEFDWASAPVTRSLEPEEDLARNGPDPRQHRHSLTFNSGPERTSSWRNAAPL